MNQKSNVSFADKSSARILLQLTVSRSCRGLLNRVIKGQSTCAQICTSCSRWSFDTLLFHSSLHTVEYSTERITFRGMENSVEIGADVDCVERSGRLFARLSAAAGRTPVDICLRALFPAPMSWTSKTGSNFRSTSRRCLSEVNGVVWPAASLLAGSMFFNRKLQAETAPARRTIRCPAEARSGINAGKSNRPPSSSQMDNSAVCICPERARKLCMFRSTRLRVSTAEEKSSSAWVSRSDMDFSAGAYKPEKSCSRKCSMRRSLLEFTEMGAVEFIPRCERLGRITMSSMFSSSVEGSGELDDIFRSTRLGHSSMATKTQPAHPVWSSRDKLRRRDQGKLNSLTKQPSHCRNSNFVNAGRAPELRTISSQPGKPPHSLGNVIQVFHNRELWLGRQVIGK